MGSNSAEYMRAYHAKRRAKARRKGCCWVCMERDAAPGKTRCNECIEDSKRRQAERRQRLKQTGKCAYCGVRPRPPGFALCKKCRKRARAASRLCQLGVTSGLGI